MRRVDVLIARLRTLSTARRMKFGELPADQSVWWQQVQMVGEELGLPLSWEDYQLVVTEQQRRSK
jgi:hypothetical protein